MAFVRAVLLAYERYGQDPSEVLRQGQITPEILADPAAPITAGRIHLLGIVWSYFEYHDGTRWHLPLAGDARRLGRSGRDPGGLLPVGYAS